LCSSCMASLDRADAEETRRRLRSIRRRSLS
jgi:hypothetical protein